MTGGDDGPAVASVEVVRTSDGRAAIGPPWGDAGYHPYWYTDGNMGCDCNRALAFYRYRGEDDDADGDMPCTTGRYTVNVYGLDGEPLLREHAPVHAKAARLAWVKP